MQAGGEWLLNSPEFRYDGSRTEGAIDVRWDRARLASNGSALDFGTLTAHLVPQGGALAGTLVNVGGDAQIDGDVALRKQYAALVENIELMREVAELLNRKRVRRGSIDFDLPEPVIDFDEAGLMQGVTRSERQFAHRLIEEFMPGPVGASKPVVTLTTR